MKKDARQQFDKIEENLINSSKTIQMRIEDQQKFITSSIPDLTKVKHYYENKINEILSDVEEDFGSINKILSG